MSSKVKYLNTTVVLLIFCFLLRLIFFLAVKPWSPDYIKYKIGLSDGWEYHYLAKNILNSSRFSSHTIIGWSRTVRTPIYPFFISFFYSIFGERPWIVLIFQILIDVASCYFLVKVIRYFLNGRVAIIAGLFYALDPIFILYSSCLVSEVLFVFFCVVSFYYISLFLSNAKKSSLLLGGFFIGLATLTRPTSQYLPILVALFLSIIFRGNLKQAIKNSLIYLFIFLITISPWMLRNYLDFGSYSISTSSSLNLLVKHASPIIMFEKGVGQETAQGLLFDESKKMMIEDGVNLYEINEFQQAKYWKRAAILYIRKNPLLFIKLYVIGIVQGFWNLETGRYCGMLGLKTKYISMREYTNLFSLIKAFFQGKYIHQIALGGTIFIFLLFSYLLLILGFFISWARFSKPFLLFCSLMLCYFILFSTSAGLARFKMPAIPFYLVFVGIGVNCILERQCRFLPKLTRTLFGLRGK